MLHRRYATCLTLFERELRSGASVKVSAKPGWFVWLVYGRRDQHGGEEAGYPQVQGRVREGVEEAEGRHPGQDVRIARNRQEHREAPARPGRTANT